jgi:hypothetical protein
MLHLTVAELCVAVYWNSIFFATKCGYLGGQDYASSRTSYFIITDY